MMMSHWIHKGQPFTEVPEGIYGFVYRITEPLSGQKYIGKKFFYARKGYTVKGKKKKKLVESDWKKYYGSSARFQELIKDCKDSCIREILYLCRTKTECAYLETKTIINTNALLLNDYVNDWMSCKIRRAHLKSILDSNQLYHENLSGDCGNSIESHREEKERII
jgi:hypothetical protein